MSSAGLGVAAKLGGGNGRLACAARNVWWGYFKIRKPARGAGFYFAGKSSPVSNNFFQDLKAIEDFCRYTKAICS